MLAHTPPTQSQPSRRRVGVSDILVRCRDVLTALQQVGQAPPLLPLQGVLALACMIVQAAQNIKTQRQSCADLAEKVVQTVVMLADELTHSSFDANMYTRIATFSEELKRIYASIQPYTRCIWRHYFWEKTTLRSVISEGMIRLDECARNVQMLNLYRMSENLVTEIAVIAGGEVRWEACMEQTLGTPNLRLCNAVLVNRTGQPRVVIKRYPQAYDERLLLEDLARLARFRHPNTPALIGKSAREAATPFAVFRELNLISLHDMFLRYMETSPAEGFMFALSIMQGVASAIQHLSWDLNFGTKDLEACMNIGNLALSGSGKVIVGYGYLLSTPGTSYNQDLSRWLILHFWRLTNEMLYGSAEPFNEDNWDTMQSKLDKHVQPLPTLVAYDCPDFPFIERRLSGILNQLEGLRRFSTRELTYPDIRRELLRTPSAHLCFVYRPKKPIDVALGDIGYMKGGSFVRLANINEDFAFVTVKNGNADYVRSAPPSIRSERLVDGTLKHTFFNPIHSNIVRQGDAEGIEDIPTIWQHFIRRAPEIASSVVGLRAEDLILSDKNSSVMAIAGLTNA
ncbi:hypothetical protein FRB98_000493 [Tulasnella sp. 332]|nr:hypothetical protein FRB98_000493 [Tulasnella sp. 332]